jgi:hypothetical protein
MRIVPDATFSPEELEILSPAVSREQVLERLDPDKLRTGPFTELLATAIAISAPDAAAAVEDTLIRYSEALTQHGTTYEAHAKLLMETMLLAHVEFHAAVEAYARGSTDVPVRSEWKNPQHYIEILKVYERRMDRLLRARKECHERFKECSEQFRQAVLTRDGLEILRHVSAAKPSVQPQPVKLFVTTPETR